MTFRLYKTTPRRRRMLSQNNFGAIDVKIWWNGWRRRIHGIVAAAILWGQVCFRSAMSWTYAPLPAVVCGIAPVEICYIVCE